MDAAQVQQQEQLCFARSISCVEDVAASPSRPSSLLLRGSASHLSPSFASQPTTVLSAACALSPCMGNTANNSAGRSLAEAAVMLNGWEATWTSQGRHSVAGSGADAAAAVLAATDDGKRHHHHAATAAAAAAAENREPTKTLSSQRAAPGGACCTPQPSSPSAASSTRYHAIPPTSSHPPTPPTPSCPSPSSEPLSCLETLDSPVPAHSTHDPHSATSAHGPSLIFSPSAAYSHADVHQLISNEVTRAKALSPSPTCLTHHRISAAMRAMTVSWMAEAVGACNLQRVTLFHAVSYLDRFFTTSKDVTVGMLQLVATACLAIACKQVEVTQPTHEEWVLIADHAFCISDLVRMEWLVVTHLAWRLRNPTPLSFMVLYCCGAARRDGGGTAAGQVAGQVAAVAQYLLELSLLQYEMLQYAYPVLAAASLVVAQQLLDRRWQLPAAAGEAAVPMLGEGEAVQAVRAALLGLDSTLDPEAVRSAGAAVHALYCHTVRQQLEGGGGGTAGALALPVQEVYRGHLPQTVLPF